MIPEAFDLMTRRRVLIRLIDYYNHNYRDPELLYQGMRYAISLRLEDVAQHFGQSLESMLIHDDKVSSAYLPVGMLQLQIADTNGRKQIMERIRALPQVDDMIISWAETIVANSETPFEHPVEKELSAIFARFLQKDLYHEISSSRVLIHDLIGDKPTQMPLGKSGELHNLVDKANKAYEASNNQVARAKLEQALFIDGTQTDVLRNLITIAADECDSEAYQRYWRRYVHLLLRQILHPDSRAKAWADLIKFYVYVSDAFENELNLAQYTNHDNLRKLIRRPGFLSQWLEVHFALIWLEALQKTHYDWQKAQSKQNLGSNNLNLARYWFCLFYPEFIPYFHWTEKVVTHAILPSSDMQLDLNFNPTSRAVKRFIQWSEETQMGLRANKDRSIMVEPHLELILSTIQLIFRSPISFHFRDIQSAVQEYNEKRSGPSKNQNLLERIKEKSWILSACTKALYLNQGELDKFHKIYADPEIQHMLTGSAFVDAAFALVEKFPISAISLGLNALQHFSLEDLTVPDEVPEEPDEKFKETYPMYLMYRNLLFGALGFALNATRAPTSSERRDANVRRLILPTQFRDEIQLTWLALLVQQIANAAVADHAKLFHQNYVEQIRTFYESRLFETIHTRMNKFTEAKKMREALNILESVTFKSPNIIAVHESLLAQIGVIAALEEQNISEAQAYLSRIKDREDLKELYENLNKQIVQVEQNSVVAPIVERVKKYMDVNDMVRARREANKIPNFAADVKLVFLVQINFIEALRLGDTSRARREVQKLPAEYAELRRSLMETVNSNEELQKLINHVNATTNGYEALRRAKQIPDKYAEVRQRLISQLNGKGYY